MPEAPIETPAIVRETHGRNTWRAELPNGKVIIAHLPRRAAHLADRIAPGTRLILEMTPYDFEKGRIARIASHA